MRVIDFNPDKLVLPEGWAARAALLTTQLMDENDSEKRRRLIDDNQIWGEIKGELKKLSHGKCWYTDSLQEGTDVDVDHFRPKKRVAELSGGETPHPGYWWLAYALENYRYSCIVANRRRRDIETGITGGKADSFPVFEEADRASTPFANYAVERALLIDPCKADEVGLIAFKEDGEAMPRWGEEEKYKYTKATRSIELYSLNHSDFVKARISLRGRIEDLRLTALRFFNRLENGDADHEKGYSDAIHALRNLQSRSSPHSGFCVALLRRYRHEEYLEGAFL